WPVRCGHGSTGAGHHRGARDSICARRAAGPGDLTVNRLQSIYRLALKELASLSRDAALLGLIIYAFTYAVYGPAKGARMELRDASVAIVDEDRSALSARLGDALLPPLFRTPRYLDGSEVDAAMDAGRYT